MSIKKIILTYFSIYCLVAILFSTTLVNAQESSKINPALSQSETMQFHKFEQFHNRLWISVGLGYQRYQFPEVSLDLIDNRTGSVTGSISNTQINAVSLDFGVFYRLKNNLLIGFETEDAFFDSFRRDWLSLRFDHKLFQNKHSFYFTPGIRVGRTRNRMKFADLNTEGIMIGEDFYDKESLFFFQDRAFSIGPSLMLSVTSGKNIRLYVSSVYNLPFTGKHGVYVKENKNFFPKSAFIENNDGNSFLEISNTSTKFINGFAVSAGIILTRN